jgi:outer membrane protein
VEGLIQMKRFLMASCLAAALGTGFAGAAAAQDVPGMGPPVGKQAGTFMLRMRAIGVIPETTSSRVQAIGGNVSATAQAAPELDLSYFFTDNIAVEAIAASTRHNISVTGSAIGNVDVGSAWVLPPTITAQYHFMPRERFSPYVGVGMTIAWWYASHPATPTVTKFTVGNNLGAALQIGFDYNFSGHWFANFDVKQILLQTNAKANTVLGGVEAHTALNPIVVGAGIAYRF